MSEWQRYSVSAKRVWEKDVDIKLILNKKSANFLLLLLAYGLGQGVLFAAQTWVLLGGNFKLLAFFGTSFSFAMLVVAVIDAGSVSILARETVNERRASGGWRRISQRYWSYCVFRLAIAAALFLIGFVVLWIYQGDQSVSGFWCFFAPVLILWSFNFTGILDGLELSGLSGFTTSLPYLFAAISVVVAHYGDLPNPGVIIGAALSAGYLSAVVTQFVSLRAVGADVTFALPTKKDLTAVAKDGMHIILSQLPGQLYFRLQLVLANYFLGNNDVALLIYAKQIVTSFMQVVAFVRRVEYPELIRRLAQSATVDGVMYAQRVGNYMAAAFSGVVAVGATGFIILGGDGEAYHAAWIVLIFAPTIISNTLLIAFQQALIAVGQLSSLSRNVAVAMSIGSLLSAGLVSSAGLIAFVVADLVQHAVGIHLNMKKIRRLL